MKDRFCRMKFPFSLLGCALLLFLSGCAAPQTTSAQSQPAEKQTDEIITNEWAVQLAPAVDADQLAAEYGAENLGQIGNLQDTYLFKRPCKILLDQNGLDPLTQDVRVLWIEQQIARQQSKRSGDPGGSNSNECK